MRKLEGRTVLKNMPLKRLGQALCGVALLFAFACAVEKQGIDTNSGGDHKRDLAKKIPLGRTVTDRVSAPGGDHTDWKYIDIEEEGTLKVTVSVDNPQVSGVLMILNELGEPLRRMTINAREHSYEFEDIPVEPKQKYFVKVAVSKYETVYSVGNTFEKKPTDVVQIMAPPEEPKTKVVYVNRKPSTPKPKDPEPVPEEDPTKIVVTTTILNFIPWKEGKATRITFAQGSEQGIKRGGTVNISTGGTCTIKEVFPRTSVCFVEKPPDSFREGTRVVITSDR